MDMARSSELVCTSWCKVRYFEAAHAGTTGPACNQSKISVAYNRRRGTLRGMHYQASPAEEIKLVRCTQGAIYDVLVDLRSGLATYGRWIAVELTASNRHALYVPGGLAHGFQTLCDDTEVFYEISTRYCPELQRGVRWDDSALAITWPDCDERIIADRDLAFPEWQPCLAS